MKLDQLSALVEKLRKAAIGEPVWLEEKHVFEYRDRSATVAAVLKLIRAAHGVSAIGLLCRAGLFIDFGALIRGINDAVSEIYFLIEEYPRASGAVEQFVAEFFARTIDEHLSEGIPKIQTKKIRAAYVRVLKGEHDDAAQKMLERIFRTFSGYVHASYSHVMGVYGGDPPSFNLQGVPSVSQRQMRMEHVDLAATSVFNATAFIALRIGLVDLAREIDEILQSDRAWQKQT